MTSKHRGIKLEEFKSEFERGGDAVRELVRSSLQEILEEEMTEALGAGKSERTSGRSGCCKRFLTTRVGRIKLRVPQDRNGVFSTGLFERCERSERRPSGLRCRECLRIDANASLRGFDAEGHEGGGGALWARLFGIDGGPDQRVCPIFFG